MGGEAMSKYCGVMLGAEQCCGVVLDITILVGVMNGSMDVGGGHDIILMSVAGVVVTKQGHVTDRG